MLNLMPCAVFGSGSNTSALCIFSSFMLAPLVPYGGGSSESSRPPTPLSLLQVWLPCASPGLGTLLVAWCCAAPIANVKSGGSEYILEARLPNLWKCNFPQIVKI